MDQGTAGVERPCVITDKLLLDEIQIEVPDAGERDLADEQGCVASELVRHLVEELIVAVEACERLGVTEELAQPHLQHTRAQ